MDKAREQAIAAAVRSGLRPAMRTLGYTPQGTGAFVRAVDGHVCKVWLQKFRHQAAFRVAMTFEPDGDMNRSVTEFGDRWTYKDSPSGRKYMFHFLRSEDAAEFCIREVESFVSEVASPWFENHLAQAKRAT